MTIACWPFDHDLVMLESDLSRYLHRSTNRRWKSAPGQWVTAKWMSRVHWPKHLLLMNINKVWMRKRKLREHSLRG
ncbi:hypothetical protein D3C79_1065120 [compost metagenome]